MKTRRRSRARGAAMVEGIVVISVMLGFLGLIVWVRQAYGTKLDYQQGTRSDVLYSASHACSGGGAQGGGSMGGLGGLPAGANAAPANGAGQMTQSWNLMEATNSTSVTYQYTVDQNAGTGNSSISYAKSPLTSAVGAHSACVCNEEKYDSQLTAWVQFGMNLWSTGGGLGALF